MPRGAAVTAVTRLPKHVVEVVFQLPNLKLFRDVLRVADSFGFNRALLALGYF